MALIKWLLPGENMHYAAPSEVEYGGNKLKFYITDQRIILHKKNGLIFKKESIVTERLEDVNTMTYKEEGILFAKKGVLRIETKHKFLEFRGKSELIKIIWQNLQQFIKR
jgi:hypothetical protein